MPEQSIKTPDEILKELESIDNDFSMLRPAEPVVQPTPELKVVQGGADPLKTEEKKPEEKKHDANSDNFFKNLLSGGVAVNIMDIVLSRGFSFACKLTGTEATYKDFKLSEDEKKQIAPFLEKYINTTGFQHLTPGQQLVIVMGMVYGYKVGELTEKQEERKDKKVEKEVKASAKDNGIKVKDAGKTIVTTDGRPWSRDTHFYSGKPKKLVYR